MREELGYDMQNDVYIFPKDLEEKHAEMVQEKKTEEVTNCIYRK